MFQLRYVAHALCFTVLMATAAPVVADDFNPPPWDREDPFATAAEWDFTDPADDANNNDFRGDERWLPDGAEVTQQPGNTGHGTFVMFGPDDGINWDQQSSLVTNPGGNGGQIVIDFDNIFDDRPLKWLRIRITAASSPDAPIPMDSVEVMGFDATDGDVTARRTATSFTPDSATGRFNWGQDWELRPNPDWERIFLNVAPDTAVDQIVTDAYSIPEPASLALVGLGGLVMLYRRRA